MTYKNDASAIEFKFDEITFTPECHYILQDYTISSGPSNVEITSESRTVNISGYISPGSYEVKISSTLVLEYDENEFGETLEFVFNL